MNIYHATYSSKLSLYRETRGIRAKNIDAAYKRAVKFLPRIEVTVGESLEIDGIMKVVKAI